MIKKKKIASKNETTVPLAIIWDVLKDKRFSKSEAKFSTRGGPKIYLKR
jgi:hypothetical protein